MRYNPGNAEVFIRILNPSSLWRRLGWLIAESSVNIVHVHQTLF
jgi:hypothetical protein